MKKEFYFEVFKLALLAAIVLIGMPGLGFAEGPVSGGVVSGTDVSSALGQIELKELPALPYILSAVCYVGGAFMLVSGTLALKRHAENPSGEKLAPGISRLVAGGAMTAIPTLTNIFQNSTLGSTNNPAAFNGFNQTF